MRRTSDHVVQGAVLRHAQDPAQPQQQAHALSSKVASVRRVCGAEDDNDSSRAGQVYEPNSLQGGEHIVAALARARADRRGGEGGASPALGRRKG